MFFPSYQRDEMHIIARARAGWENRNLIEVFSNSNFYPQDGLMVPFEYILFYLIRPIGYLGFDFKFVYLATCILSVFLCLKIVYAFFFDLTKRNYIATFLTFLLCFNDLFERFSLHPSEPLLIARWPFPAIHYAIIFQFLRINQTRLVRSKYDGLITSSLIGLSFYSYFYTWQILGAIIISLLVIHLVHKDMKSFKNLLLYSIGGLFLATPFIWKLIKSLDTEESKFSELFMSSMGKVNTRQIELTVSIVVLILIAIYLKLMLKSKYSQFAFLASFSSLMVYNQQFFSGIQIQPGHYHWYWIKPIAYVLLALILFEIFHSLKELRSLVIVMTVSMVCFASFQNSFYSEYQPNMATAAAISEFDFEEISGVVFTNSEQISDIIVTNTRVQLDWHSFSKLYRGQDLSYREAQNARLAWEELGIYSPEKNFNSYLEEADEERGLFLQRELQKYFEVRGVEWIILKDNVTFWQKKSISNRFRLVFSNSGITVYSIKELLE
jgi:hypothetical protein